LERLMSFDSLFAPALSDDARGPLRRQITAHRMKALRFLLARGREPGTRERLGPGWERLARFVRDLLALGDREPDRLGVADHWATTFFLSRILYDPMEDEERLGVLLDALHSLLVDDAVRTGRFVEGAVYETRSMPGGGFYALLDDGRLSVDGVGEGRHRFTFAQGRVRIEPVGGDGPVVETELPPAPGAAVRIEPLPTLAGWDLPLVRDSQSLGAEPRRPEPEPVEGWDPAPLDGSLVRAHGLLQRYWPEILDWVDLSVPAFVDMGTPAVPQSQRSESYGPGSPIFLSAAATDLQIAEAVVHELQHHRLLLFTRAEDFPRFADGTRQYVSPWRPDVRPLRGVYLAVHAFLAVNELRLRTLADRALDENARLQLLQTHCMNLYGFRTILEHEQFSDLGRRAFQLYALTLADQHRRLQAMVHPDDHHKVETFFDRHVAAVERQPEGVVNNGPRYRAWDETVDLARRLGAEEVTA
jgi:HEXXH motif-containing protein